LKRVMRNFAANGIPVTDRLAKKLWLASKIQGHRNPFGKPLIEYSVAQLDFILEMAALDEPDRYSFVRESTTTSPGASAATLASWADVLSGTLQAAYMDRLGITQGNRALALYAAKHGAGLTPGFSRGGKPIDASGNAVHGKSSRPVNGAAW
jgi:hypothetical protein